MPHELPGLLAGGTIRRCRFVKPSTTEGFTVLEADANEAIIGVSSDAAQDAPIPSAGANAAEDGDHLLVNPIGSVCLLEAGTGGWTAGDELKSDADGKGVSVATTGTTIQEIGAVALSDATAGDLARVLVIRDNRRPALS